MVIVSEVPQGSHPLLVAGTAGAFRFEQVRGARGLFSERSLEGPQGQVATLHSLTWMERPDIAVTIMGELDLSAMLELAESLREVERAEFEAEAESTGLSG
jgi:hypothetical protein